MFKREGSDAIKFSINLQEAPALFLFLLLHFQVHTKSTETFENSTGSISSTPTQIEDIVSIILIAKQFAINQLQQLVK